MAYMFANHPKVARKMANRMKKKYGKKAFKKLPKSVRRKKK